MLSDITREQVDGEDEPSTLSPQYWAGLQEPHTWALRFSWLTERRTQQRRKATLAVDVSVPRRHLHRAGPVGRRPFLCRRPDKERHGRPHANRPLCFPPRLLNVDIIRVDRGRGPLLRRRGQCSVRWDRAVRLLEPSTGRGLPGTLSQTIRNNQSVSGTGTFNGNGILNGALSEGSESTTCGDNDTMPVGSETCLTQSGDILVSGSVNATGRFVSNGQSEFIRHYDNASFTAAGRFVVQDGASGKISGNGVFQGGRSVQWPDGT